MAEFNKSEFQKYLATKKKLTKEFKNVDELEEKYKKVMQTKTKLNEYQKSYHNDMMKNDPEYVAKRKEYNKQSYQRYKEKNPYIPKKKATQSTTQQQVEEIAQPETIQEKEQTKQIKNLDSFFDNFKTLGI
jgi:hypothetical protein